MTAAIYKALKTRKAGKSWEGLVGYTASDLTKHIERQFTKGMGWDNMGEWHIDHIRPVASFNFATPEDQDFKACWDLTNLRPLWARENFIKNHKRMLLL